MRSRGLRYASVPMPDDYLALSHHGKRIMCAPGSYGAQLYPSFAELKHDDDAVFVEQYYSAFTNKGLAAYFRSKAIATVAIAGVSASNCILAAATDVFFNELDVYVLSACVGASSKVLHQIAMEKIATYYGCVVSDVLNVPTASSLEVGGALQL